MDQVDQECGTRNPKPTGRGHPADGSHRTTVDVRL